MTTRGCPAARSRVQALYGSTIAGHLHGPDRKLLVRASRKDDKEHVRFVPADETLPRFRIPLTEFPSETKWNRPELKAEWGRELTVKFAEWPPENQLPSATFSPALQSQVCVLPDDIFRGLIRSLDDCCHSQCDGPRSFSYASNAAAESGPAPCPTDSTVRSLGDGV